MLALERRREASAGSPLSALACEIAATFCLHRGSNDCLIPTLGDAAKGEMAKLRNVATGRICMLEAEHRVGRSSRCELRIDRPEVSGQHALVRWNGRAWEVKDLASRNGTLVDDARVSGHGDHPLRLNAVVRFGCAGEDWVLVDDTPPKVMVIALDATLELEAQGAVLAVPSADHVEVTLYQITTGEWQIERQDGSSVTIHDNTVFAADGRSWRFCCPSIVAQTQVIGHQHLLQQSVFVIGVSQDEEHVELKAKCGGQDLELGTRSHNYLLLTLARARIAEIQDGVPEPTSGWIYQDDLAMDQGQLNVEVFRLRKQLESAGFVDAVNIIERRPSTKQIRVGATKFEIRRI